MVVIQNYNDFGYNVIDYFYLIEVEKVQLVGHYLHIILIQS